MEKDYTWLFFINFIIGDYHNKSSRYSKAYEMDTLKKVNKHQKKQKFQHYLMWCNNFLLISIEFFKQKLFCKFGKFSNSFLYHLAKWYIGEPTVETTGQSWGAIKTRYGDHLAYIKKRKQRKIKCGSSYFKFLTFCLIIYICDRLRINE